MIELHSLSRALVHRSPPSGEGRRGGGLGWGCRRESHCPSGENSPTRIASFRCDTTSPASGRGEASSRPDRFDQMASRFRHGAEHYILGVRRHVSKAPKALSCIVRFSRKRRPACYARPRNDERSGRESINSEWPANVRLGAHSGPKSDIATVPKSAPTRDSCPAAIACNSTGPTAGICTGH
jgi:hypothetical protein